MSSNVKNYSTEWETERIAVELTKEGVYVDLVDGDGSHSITLLAEDLRERDFIRIEDAYEHCNHDHCDDGDCHCPPQIDFGSSAVMAIEDWHNRRHTGVFRFCIEDPCIGFVQAVNEL